MDGKLLAGIAGLACGALLNRFVLRRFTPEKTVWKIPLRPLVSGSVAAGVGLGGYVLLPEPYHLLGAGVGGGVVVEEVFHRLTGK
ncbi:MAG: hypothetical protein QXR87_03340 [Candidatus Hadarchaeales archaeon]